MSLREGLLSSSPPSHSHAISIPSPSPSPSPSPFQSSLAPLPEHSELPPPPPSSPSLKSLLIYGPSASSSSADDASSNYPPLPPPPPSPSPRSGPALDDTCLLRPSPLPHHLHRCFTDPGILNPARPPSASASSSSSSSRPRRHSVVCSAILFLTCYLFFGVIIYSLASDHFSSSSRSTHPLVDALYFCIVTMCTIGYGDITPATPLAKLFSILFVIVGFGFVDILLSAMVSFVLDLQESLLLTAVNKPPHPHGHNLARRYIVDVKKGRMRIRLKVALALGVVLLCVGLGSIVLCFIENLSGLDALYLSVMSVTTVGYGDQAFKTMPGRLFASIWLLFSTLAVARAFLYLAEMRIEKRHRKIAKWVLSRDLSFSEFMRADIDHNGYVTKSEFVVYKLKEMGKISEKDVMPICEQFDRIDDRKTGKIRLSDLIDSNHLDTSRNFLSNKSFSKHTF